MTVLGFLFVCALGLTSLFVCWHSWWETRRQRLELNRWLRNVAGADITEAFTGTDPVDGKAYLRLEMFVDTPLPFGARVPAPGDRVLVWIDHLPVA